MTVAMHSQKTRGFAPDTSEWRGRCINPQSPTQWATPSPTHPNIGAYKTSLLQQTSGDWRERGLGGDRVDCGIGTAAQRHFSLHEYQLEKFYTPT